MEEARLAGRLRASGLFPVHLELGMGEVMEAQAPVQSTNCFACRTGGCLDLDGVVDGASGGRACGRVDVGGLYGS